MKEEIDGFIIANDIKMSRDADEKKVYIIVEGESDFLLYKNFFHADCEIKISLGKENAIDTIIDIETYGYDGVICIIDRDFYDLGDVPRYQSEKIFLTDLHDIETMIMHSQALNKLLDQFGSKGKIEKNSQSILECAFPASVFIGYLRWYAKCVKLNLDFKTIELRKNIDKTSLNLDKVKFVNSLILNTISKTNLSEDDKQKIKVINRSQLIDRIDQFVDTNNLNPLLISCGHDLVKIISICLCKKFGSLNIYDTDMDGTEGAKIEKNLLLAYDYRYFMETNLYRSLISYQETSHKYILNPYYNAS